jgi:hypothetical protein
MRLDQYLVAVRAVRKKAVTVDAQTRHKTFSYSRTMSATSCAVAPRAGSATGFTVVPTCSVKDFTGSVGKDLSEDTSG